MNAGTLEIQLLANMARLQKDMEEAKRSVGSAMSSIEGSVAAAKSALQGLAAGLSVAAFAGMIKGAVDLADNLNDLSKTTGLAVTQLAGLKLAAKQSGGDLEGIAASINKLSVAMGKDAERFAQLGVTAKDPLEAFKQLADVFSAIQDPQLRAALGAEALGKSWASAAPLLSEGSKNIADMVAKGTALSGVTQEMADQADKFNDRLAELEAVSGRAKMKLAEEMLPAMTEITAAIMAAYEESGKLQAVWVALGSLGAFAFTDQFATATVKLGKLREELAQLEEEKYYAENQPMVGIVSRWLFGSADLDGDIAKKKAAIADLQAQMDKPSKDAAQRRADAEAKKKADAESAEASRKASEFLKLQSDAEKARAAAVKAANEELKKQAALVAELSGLSSSFSEDWNRLSAMFNAGRLSLNDLTDAQAKLLAKQPAVKAETDAQAQATKDLARAQEDARKQLEQYYTGLEKNLISLEESNKRLREQVEEIGLDTVALNALRLARLDATIAQEEEILTMASAHAATQEEIRLMQKRIDLLKEQRTLTAQGQEKEVTTSAAKSAFDEWKKTADKIQDSITDALMRGFESGKGFAENLRDTVVNMFKTMVLRPVVEIGVRGSLSALGLGGLSGAANAAAGAGGVGDSYAGLSMLSGMKSWLTDFGGGVASQVSKLGNYLSSFSNSTVSGWGEGLMNNATAIGEYAQVAGNALGYFNAALAASEGKWGKAIGTGVGTYFGGPIGAAIGGAIGSWVDNAFGGGHEYTTGTGISGKFSGNSFSGRNYQDWRNDGSSGFFGIGASGSSSGTNYSAMDTGLQKSLGSAFAGIKTQTAAFALALGLSATSIQAFSKDIKLSLGSDAAANQQAISSMMQGIANDAASTVLDTQYIRQGEAAADTLARLATNLTLVNGSFHTLDKIMLTTSQASGDVASQLVDALGGLQQYQSGMAAYYQAYYSEEERQAKTREQTRKALADLGFAMPATLQGYRDLVTAQDVSTEAGRKTFAALINLSTAFASVTSEVDSLQTAFVSTAKGIKTLVDSIASVRSGVASDRLGLGPQSVMDMDSIRAAVAAISASAPAPSTAAMDAARLAASTADATLTTAQATAEAKAAALATATTAKASTIAYYEGKRLELQALADKYSPAGTYINFTSGSGSNDDAYKYNAATNKLNPFSYISYAGYTNTLTTSVGGIQVGSASTTYNPDVAGMKADPAYKALNTVLGGGNTVLAKAATAVASATTALATAQTALATATGNKSAADAAATAAALAYSQAVDAWTVEASKSVPALDKLREQTLKYYESQKALAELMGASAANLRVAVQSSRSGQLDSAQSLAQQQATFATAYSMALSTSGAVQAGYADKLTATLPELSAALMDTATSRADWAQATAKLFAQSESVAKLLETNAPVNYQADSLAMLDSIDATLALLDDSTRSITRAIESSGGLTAAGLREVVQALGGTPTFSGGGFHSGGLRIVGENGPELEATGPSRIFDAGQTRSILGGGSSNTARLEALVERQGEQLEAMRYELRAIATSNSQIANTLKRVTPDGNSLQTVTAT